MDERDRVEAYRKLYERQMAHYENTQAVEWKVSIAVWTLLAVAIAWVGRGNYPPGIPGAAAFLVPAFHGLWLYRIHRSEQYDKMLWVRYRTAARAVLLSPERVPLDEQEHRRDWLDEAGWIAVEVGVTLMMAGVLFLFISD